MGAAWHSHLIKGKPIARKNQHPARDLDAFATFAWCREDEHLPTSFGCARCAALVKKMTLEGR